MQAAAQIDDYESSVDKISSFAEYHNHRQLGGPAKLAKALLELAEPVIRRSAFSLDWIQ